MVIEHSFEDLLELSHVGEAKSHEKVGLTNSRPAAAQDVVLARALIHSVCLMRADGYENEIVVNGETWRVEVTRKLPVSPISCCD